MVTLTGCPKPAAYKEPITRFQQASAVVIEGARVEYASANERERDALIDRLVQDKKPITLKAVTDKEFVLLTSADLDARMKALNALSKHGQLLLALASSDAPVRAKDAANSLGDAISNLSTSLKDSSVSNTLFKDNATGFAAIAGEIVELVLNSKINEALDKSITASEQHVTSMIRLLSSELELIYERRKSNLSTRRVAAIDKYQEAQRKMDIISMKKTAEEIKTSENNFDKLPLLLGSGTSLDAMSDAHQELVSYAKSPKHPQDLASLNEALDTFITRARVVADSINKIKQKGAENE